MLIVTAPMVQARTADKVLHYVRQGAPLPEGLADGQAEHLLSLGLVVDTEAEADAKPKTAKTKAKTKTPEKNPKNPKDPDPPAGDNPPSQ